MRSHVPSNRVWSSAGYARAVRVDRLVEVSGTAAATPGGEILHPGDMYAQTVATLDIIEWALIELGASLQDVIRTRMYLTDLSQWEQAARAHGERFADVLPASTMVEVTSLLHPDMLIEIEATAFLST